MEQEVLKKLEDAIWVGNAVFMRDKTAGSSANMSFRYGDHIYITGSGTCFGRLQPDDFSILDLTGNHLKGPKPSKEYPLHLLMYDKEGIEAVIHTHGTYTVLWSCVSNEPENDYIPMYTPYLDMKLGPVKVIGYYKPGSQELFSAMRDAIDDRDGYVLKNHGAIIRASSMMSAFYNLEELEESSKLAFLLRDTATSKII